MKGFLKKIILGTSIIFGVSSCGLPSFNGAGYDDSGSFSNNYDTNTYNEIVENDFIDTKDEDKSYFSMASSTAAYTNIRSLVMDQNTLPNANAVKIEEMLNYFKYNYQVADKNIGVFNELSDCPWNSENKIASIAVKAKSVSNDNVPMNLVFLIDISGSMNESIDLIKKSFSMLVNNLTPTDKISIVTYASGVSTVLDSGNGSEKSRILNIINNLKAGGSTNGEGGIQKAYELATKNFITGGNNRIILATDGDFNVGISDSDDLGKYIAEKRESGVYLSVLGFGMGNYHSNIAESLATNGNGNVFYINSLKEAMSLFGENMNIFKVVAKDCKAAVIFDQTQVSSYRLIGYENSLLTEDQYNDSKTDAGELLSSTVTIALYEIKLETTADTSKAFFTSELSYISPETGADLIEKGNPCSYTNTPSSDFIFQTMVAEYGLLLRNSKHKGNASYEHILNTYEANSNKYELDQLKKEFYELVKKTKSLVENNSQN